MHDNESVTGDAPEIEGLGDEHSLDDLLANDPHDADPAPRPNLQMLRNIPVRVTLEVDSVDIELADLLALSRGTVLALDKAAGAPLDMRVNGVLLGRAEVVVVDGRYGLRLLEIVNESVLAGLA
ncbi:MAG: FliM/FliN family flagellar motor switch protein [Spongiibacteraceae bacterium]|nr:FliM/FliN family flagellar motor switch protein [Spongiibacteraceae bacterium]